MTGPLVLGIDTATRIASAGVARGRRAVGEVSEDAPGGHAASLASLVERALRAAGTDLEEIDAIAVSVGPGSFTGLRIGTGFAKGVAFARRKALVGVSTLEALAGCAPEECSTVAVALDARKGEVYLGLFRRSAAGVTRQSEDRALRPERAALAIEAAGKPTVVLGDGPSAHRQAFAGLESGGVRILGFDVLPPSGAAVAVLGGRLLERGQTTAPEALLPVYVRASEAEMRAAAAALTVEGTVS